MKLIGDGGYRELSPKRFELWQFVEVDGRRKQRTKRVRCGKRDVGEALRDFQSELAGQLPPADSFSVYAASWCAWRRECGRYSESTCRNYESVLRAVGGRIGRIPLGDVTPQDCRDALMSLKAERNLSGTTLAFHHQVMRGAFEAAVRDGLIASNPMAWVERPAKDTRERKAMSPAEMDALWDRLCAMPLDGCAMAVFLAVDCGLRIGECVWLDAKDVGDASLRVTRSKTKAGKGRVIPLTGRLSEKCAEWRAERERRGIADAEAFCCQPNGRPMVRQTMHYWYQRNREALGAPERFHDIRHSNLSKMARFMSAHDLQRWAGWSGLEMAQRYVHDDYSQLEQAVSRAECWADVGQQVSS